MRDDQSSEKPGRPDLWAWLGLTWQPQDAPWLGRALGGLIVALGLVLAVSVVVLVVAFPGAIFGSLTSGGTAEAVRNIGLALAAVVGAPFLAWRSIVAHRQARIARQSLANDKLATALADLYARREVTKWTEGAPQTGWEDDVIRRVGAIDRLEGLVQEDPTLAPRIANQLSAYVRELSREHLPAQPPSGLPPAELGKWAGRLKPPRSDIEKAAQTLGRLGKIPGVDRGKLHIDLRGANLQAADLGGLDFAGADMRVANLDGAYLFGADLEGAAMNHAFLIGARLTQARLKDADLTWAFLQTASLERAVLDGARLSGAYLEGAKIEGASLIYTDLFGAQMSGADLSWAWVSGTEMLRHTTVLTGVKMMSTAFHRLSLEGMGLTQKQIAWTFGDGSVSLPEGLERPSHWPTAPLGEEEFRAEWQKWRENPTSYAPPQAR